MIKTVQCFNLIWNTHWDVHDILAKFWDLRGVDWLCQFWHSCPILCQYKNFSRLWCLTQTQCYCITSPLHVVLTRHISFIPRTCSKHSLTLLSSTSIQTPIPSTMIGVNIETPHYVKTQNTAAIWTKYVTNIFLIDHGLKSENAGFLLLCKFCL